MLVPQERAAVIERVPFGLVRQFINERFYEKAVPGSLYAAPSASGYMGGVAVGFVARNAQTAMIIPDWQ